MLNGKKIFKDKKEVESFLFTLGLILFFTLIIVLGAWLVRFSGTADPNNSDLPASLRENIYRARVIAVEDEEIGGTHIQTLQIRITNRDLRGTEVSITKTIMGNAVALRNGNRIMVRLQPSAEGAEPVFFFNSYDRTLPLLFLFLFFILCVIILGRLKGIRAIIALSLTFATIFFILVPMLLRGWNPILLGIITCIFATLMTVSICFGVGKKSLSALIGISGGLLIGGIIAYLFGLFTRIAGIGHGDAHYLLWLPNAYRLDFRGLLFAGIIIGALGACQDVAISVSSSMTELKTNNSNIGRKELINSGFNIGRDIMGSMVNTLVLAYTGGALASIMVFVGFGRGFSEIINMEFIATEIVRAIAGSLGLLFAIPLTIFAFVLLDSKIKKNKQSTPLKSNQPVDDTAINQDDKNV